MPYAYDYVQGASNTLRFNRIFIFNQETGLLIRPIDEGNYRRFINFCKRFLYNTPFVTSMDLRWTAVRIDKEKGKKWSGVSKDRLVYVLTGSGRFPSRVFHTWGTLSSMESI